jgi:4-diphosphocytidyl-2-C-methyl-D-erythritol kinase
VISFPPCKINLGLRILRKRSDGYHDIETCFFPVGWTDVLEIIPASETKFNQTGIPIAGDATSNIVYKAYEILKRDFSIGPVEIHLHKIIPHGAGLGGGSSDAAHALKLLNTIFQLNLSLEQLKQYALMLGSDCPFFLETKPMLGSGRGEVLESYPVDLAGKYLTLIKPDVHVSTAEAYADVVPDMPPVSLRELLKSPLNSWRDLIVNDFEKSVFLRHPKIKEIKDFLYQEGAVYASMSGSGSTVYGIFNAPFDLTQHFPSLASWSGKI